MPTYQIVGDNLPLGKSVTNPPTHGGGNPNPKAQLIGDSLPLTRTQTSPPTHTTKMGAVQEIGDRVPLGRTISYPWEQAKLPMSTTADQPAGREKK
jgi:hypothetical protein